MKKNIIKFIIIFSLIFSVSDSKVFAQFSKKISGEQLEKLLTENYILINGRFGSFKWEFNKDKTYYVTPRHDKTLQMPNNGTWEITGIFGSSLILTDRQQIINGRNIKYQFFFGEDGYIYTGSERMHSYGLENIQERINKEARLVEEKRVAEELRLKKIEEEKRQLAIKREQELIKQEKVRIKQEEEKKRFQADLELILKKDKERREKQEREDLYASIVKYSILGLFLLILSYFTYKYKLKIKNLYLKFINLIRKLKNNIPKNNKLTAYLRSIKDLKTDSKILILSCVLTVMIILYNVIYNFLFVKTIVYCWDYNKYSSYEQSKNDKSKLASSFGFEINYLKKTVKSTAVWNDPTLAQDRGNVKNMKEKDEGGSIIRIFSDNLIEIEQDNDRVYSITKIYPKTAEASNQGFIKPLRVGTQFFEKISFSANFKCKHE